MKMAGIINNSGLLQFRLLRLLSDSVRIGRWVTSCGWFRFCEGRPLIGDALLPPPAQSRLATLLSIGTTTVPLSMSIRFKRDPIGPLIFHYDGWSGAGNALRVQVAQAATKIGRRPDPESFSSRTGFGTELPGSIATTINGWAWLIGNHVHSGNARDRSGTHIVELTDTPIDLDMSDH